MIIQIINLKATFSELTFLDLSNNQILRLPQILGTLPLTYFDCSNNPIVSPPSSVISRGTKATLAYLKGALLTDLINNEQFSDIKMRTNGYTCVFAHGAVIACRWPSVIKVETMHEFKEGDFSVTVHVQQNEYIVSGISDIAFDLLLHYLYTNRLDYDLERTRFEKEDFIKHFSELQQVAILFPEFRKENRLPLLCKHFIMVAKGEETSIPQELLLEDFIEFDFTSIGSKFSDVTLEIDGKTLKTHKIILCQRSLYFRTMFASSFSESTQQVVPLEHGSYEAVHAILYCLYSGTGNKNQVTCHGFKVPFRNKYLDRKNTTEKINLLMEMVGLTSVYSMPDIHLASDLELGSCFSTLNLENLVDLLDFAESHFAMRFYDKVLTCCHQQHSLEKVKNEIKNAPENIRVDVLAKYGV